MDVCVGVCVDVCMETYVNVTSSGSLNKYSDND